MRKTMLDDCKGPKFEEVLAVFSTAVLRKVVGESTQDPGLRLAFAKALTENELEEKLVPLIIAYHSTLGSTRRNQMKIRENHDQFSKLLEEKAQSLSVRSSGKSHTVEKPPHADSLMHDLKANWLGSQNLVDTLLNGGSSVERDSFLELPFEKAWYHARKGNVDQLNRSSQIDSLQDLEKCLSQQRARMHRLREIKNSVILIEQKSGAKAITNSHDKDQSLVFRDHQTLTVADASNSSREIVKTINLCEEHQAVLSSIRATLSEVKGTAVQQKAARSKHAHTNLVEPSPPNLAVNNRSALSPIPDTEQFATSHSPSVRVYDFEEDLPATGISPSVENADRHGPPQFESKVDIAVEDLDGSDSLDPADLEVGILSNSRQESSEDAPMFQLEPLPASLLDRTRQSMSLLPPPPNSRSRQSLAAQREMRQSQYFPVNQFSTPPKEKPESSRSGASTPRDEIFSEEAEYASIFKSRPRVALSPLMSPAIHANDDDETEEYVGDSESFLDLAVDGSPLASKRR